MARPRDAIGSSSPPTGPLPPMRKLLPRLPEPSNVVAPCSASATICKSSMHASTSDGLRSWARTRKTIWLVSGAPSGSSSCCQLPVLELVVCNACQLVPPSRLIEMSNASLLPLSAYQCCSTTVARLRCDKSMVGDQSSVKPSSTSLLPALAPAAPSVTQHILPAGVVWLPGWITTEELVVACGMLRSHRPVVAVPPTARANPRSCSKSSSMQVREASSATCNTESWLRPSPETRTINSVTMPTKLAGTENVNGVAALLALVTAGTAPTATRLLPTTNCGSFAISSITSDAAAAPTFCTVMTTSAVSPGSMIWLPLPPDASVTVAATCTNADPASKAALRNMDWWRRAIASMSAPTGQNPPSSARPSSADQP